MSDVIFLVVSSSAVDSLQSYVSVMTRHCVDRNIMLSLLHDCTHALPVSAILSGVV